MSAPMKQEERAAAAALLAQKAELAGRCGSRAKAAELHEAAMFVDPSPERIRAWLRASAQTGSAAHRDALLEAASWF